MINILVRTAGGRAKKKELGLGHIYRTINLASFLKTKKINFLLEDYGGAKEIITSNGYETIFSIHKEPSFTHDIEKTLKIIQEKNIDLVIIDKFKIQKSYVKKIKKYAKVVVISDLKNINYDCHLLINGFIGFKNKKYYNKYGTCCLLGPLYQIINKDFIQKNNVQKKKYDLITTFGGFDENNISEIVLKVLNKNFNLIKNAKIILGPATKTNLKKYPNLKNRVEIIDKSKNFFKDVSKSKFGLCSGGMTAYEFAAMNVPFAIICQVKHQLISSKIWEKNCKAINLGYISNKTEFQIHEIFKKISENRLDKSFSKKKIVDGLGGIRVAKEIENLVNK